MDIFTHMFMGVLAGLFTLTVLSPEAIIFMWAMSFALDLDIFLEPLQKIRKMYFLSHKAASHSYIIGFAFTGIISLLLSVFRNVSILEVWIAGFIGYSIHVSLDFFAASKIPIFYPISKREFRFIADRAVNPLLAFFSGLNLLILILVYFALPYYQVLMNFAIFYLYTYLAYFGIRAFLRIIIQVRLPKNQKYIPGFLPFFYLIYEINSTNESLSFKLKRSSIFTTKKQELLSQTIRKSSNEIDFFELARKVSHDFRFFHKWSFIIPFITQTEEIVNVVLILAESFSQSLQHKSIKRGVSSYYILIKFNKTSKKPISKIESFGSFNKWKQEIDRNYD
jgi:membrane-bound metal-dependent hydrolase YbcI (DUF457 family)